jgi:hypothetical protein
MHYYPLKVALVLINLEPLVEDHDAEVLEVIGLHKTSVRGCCLHQNLAHSHEESSGSIGPAIFAFLYSLACSPPHPPLKTRVIKSRRKITSTSSSLWGTGSCVVTIHNFKVKVVQIINFQPRKNM